MGDFLTIGGGWGSICHHSKRSQHEHRYGVGRDKEMCRKENRISLLQVGDIHFPENKNKKIVDYKDTDVPLPFIDKIVPTVFPIILRKVHQLLTNNKFHGVMFCGDFTSGGVLEGYKECLSYLKDNILSSGGFSENQIHAVPGNHDIDRELCDPTGKDNETKFATLRDAWREIGFPVLSYRSPVIQNSINNKVSIYSMNSCIGCGVVRNYPEEISEVIVRKVNKLYEDKDITKERFHELKAEILDTPAFLQDELSHVQTEIQTLSSETLPIILAHHNILPQFTPRVSVYGELLNAGVFRDSLIRKSENILYCHGHIHEDPVEIISTPEQDHKIICVSAPELIKGFNVIHIEYSSQNIPLGCHVEKYRINRGDVDCEQLQIHFYGPDRLHDICGQEAVDVARCLTKVPLLVKNIYSSLNKRITQKNIARYLSDIEWFRIVRINNKEREFKEWHVSGRLL